MFRARLMRWFASRSLLGERGFKYHRSTDERKSDYVAPCLGSVDPKHICLAFDVQMCWRLSLYGESFSYFRGNSTKDFLELF